jgi:branched-chain amino acid transport system substrate-binding protein
MGSTMNVRLTGVLLAASLWTLCAQAQPIRLGELNSYKQFPSFLEPYRKGMELARDEVNAAGGVLGRPLEILSRDDTGAPGDAVRVAEELIARDKVALLMGTFASNVGLAVADLARQRKTLFIAAEPLTDKIVWDDGNAYTFRLRASTYMQTAMLVPEAAKLGKQRWAIVYPNYEYGQAATATFKAQMIARAPAGIEFVEQAVPLGKIEAGSVVQALIDAKPDATTWRASYVRASCAACSRTVRCSTCSAANPSTSTRSRTRRRSAGGSPDIRGTRSTPRRTSASSPRTRRSSTTIRAWARWSGTRR